MAGCEKPTVTEKPPMASKCMGIFKFILHISDIVQLITIPNIPVCEKLSNWHICIAQLVPVFNLPWINNYDNYLLYMTLYFIIHYLIVYRGTL